MFDSCEELLDKIRLGEDNALELKRVVLAGREVKGPKRGDLADELAAMANTADGVCVLGVDTGPARCSVSPWRPWTPWSSSCASSATTA